MLLVKTNNKIKGVLYRTGNIQWKKGFLVLGALIRAYLLFWPKGWARAYSGEGAYSRKLNTVSINCILLELTTVKKPQTILITVGYALLITIVVFFYLKNNTISPIVSSSTWQMSHRRFSIGNFNLAFAGGVISIFIPHQACALYRRRSSQTTFSPKNFSWTECGNCK